MEVAEAMAIRKAIQYAKSVGVEELVVESDCSRIVKALVSRVDTLTSCEAILMDCLDLCRDFKWVDFSFVRRTGNRVAHGLTQVAQDVSLHVPATWFKNVHHSVKHLVEDDLIIQ